MLRCQYVGYPFWRLGALAYGNQATHDVADHMVQERIGFKLEPPVGPALADVDVTQRFNGAERLALHGPER